ncbi:nucleoside triphosphate pyrophosphohydrolase [Paenibacillus brevis]|uniref:Nucleoside triphosphate pyrophosphohydrolase n=1 Tax=Paenibacillus brevis TaxID=2841508 RepID=A0ABS6FS15_9BACL|nr:nucleoside triphosphate pyrophosphohydrolase [Paenibacillus brevis]MBU5672813.1 nucleoside triphosphate pyrophosphohydrolase [Paenibacillus brevis]
MKIYNKVIRDEIPGIIEKSGKKYEIKELDDEQYLEGLKEKLAEELDEFQMAEEIEELADMIEVIYAIARLKDVSVEQLEELRRKKVETNGGFTKNLLLIKTYD